mgnify:FL=1
MKSLKIFLFITIASAWILPHHAMAIKLIYKDNRGHYHFRCTDKTGGVTIVVYRAEGVYVDGPNGQEFFPADTASIVRSEEYFKITEKYARWGCKEKLRR